VDALGFLEAVTGIVPSAVAAGFMASALAHFRDLLGRDTRGASIKSRSLATLHKVRVVCLCSRDSVCAFWATAS
jgi:hypothetical protein